MTDSDQWRNEFSGSAETVVQVARNLGTINIHQLPAVPLRPAEVPRQVPAASRGFVNRSRELAFLDDLVEDAGEPPRIVLCAGLRGVGKSAVVRRWVHRMRDRFPGGDLYVDFGQLSSRGGAAVSDAITACLRGLGVDDRFMPSGRAELAALFRTRTAGAPVLVVLDDVAEPAQVMDLVPHSPGSVVVATSDAVLGELRREGALLMRVEPLDDQSAYRLLIELCGRPRVEEDSAATAELVRLCAGHPVALQVVAGRLAEDEFLPAAELAAELSAAGGRLPGLTAVLDCVVAGLPEPVALLYRRLGLVPSVEFGRRVADLALGAEASDALAALVARRLVERVGRDRFQWHPLVRAHAITAAEQATDPQAPVIVRTVVEFYLTTAMWADRAAMGGRTRISPSPQGADPFGGNPAVALDWLESERPTLMACQTVAYERGWPDVTWHLAETMTALFLNRRHLADWTTSGRLGVIAAREDGRADAQIRLHCLTSRPLSDLGRSSEALTGLDEALDLAEALGDRLLLGSVWEFRARCLETVDPAAAIDGYRQSIACNQAAGDDSNAVRGAALARFFLGSFLHTQGRSGEAAPELQAARTTLEQLGDRRMSARAQVALGRALTSEGDLAAAAAMLAQAIAVFAAGGWMHYEADALEALAELRETEGDLDSSRDYLTRARDIHQRFHSPRTEQFDARLAAL